MMGADRLRRIGLVTVLLGAPLFLSLMAAGGRPTGTASWRNVVGTQTGAIAADLHCEITPLRAPLHVGDHPAFKVVFHNVGGKTFYLVGALDGSAEGMRSVVERTPDDGRRAGDAQAGAPTGARRFDHGRCVRVMTIGHVKAQFHGSGKEPANE